MKIILTGYNPFADPTDINQHRSVAEIGGIDQLVKTNQGRNMWAIMKQFNVLPTDKRLQEMNKEQISFVILSMNEDNKELDRARRGVTLDSDYADKEFDKEVAQATGDWKIMKDGQDPEEIYKQVVDKTHNSEYEERLNERLNTAKTTRTDAKNRELEAVSQYMAEQFDKAQERAKRLKKTTVNTDDLVDDIDLDEDL